MTAFSDRAAFLGHLADMPAPDPGASAAAASRDATLTKPPGSLGRLESLAFWYCGWRGAAVGDGSVRPRKPQVVVFAGNHGVAARGVSAFPAEVTAQMVANFEAGGAAVNQLCGMAGAALDIHSLSLDRPTADFTQAPAMDEAALLAALSAGWNAVDREADLLVVGEMGIGNTTSAAAISAALWGGRPEDWVGRGSGVAGPDLARKAQIVGEGLARHGSAAAGDPLEALRRLGGREIAAMAAAILRARTLRLPVLLDGFVCGAAASVLAKSAEGALDHAEAGHLSAEAAHIRLLDRLGKTPILDLQMALGEASGGVLAIAVLQAAMACHDGMASFDQAGVATA